MKKTICLAVLLGISAMSLMAQPAPSTAAETLQTRLKENTDTLKRGLIHPRTFTTCAEARAAIFEWIEVFYNRTRLHSALGFKSPVDFETKLN